MSTTELATYLFPVIDSTNDFPVVDSSTKWTLLQKARHDRYIAAMMMGPTPIIRDWSVQRQIPSDGIPFDIFTLSDDWCLEFLRFTKRQICEIAFLLAIPDNFPNRNFCPPTTALSLVCFRLAWPHRLKDCRLSVGLGLLKKKHDRQANQMGQASQNHHSHRAQDLSSLERFVARWC